MSAYLRCLPFRTLLFIKFVASQVLEVRFIYSRCIIILYLEINILKNDNNNLYYYMKHSIYICVMHSSCCLNNIKDNSSKCNSFRIYFIVFCWILKSLWNMWWINSFCWLFVVLSDSSVRFFSSLQTWRIKHFVGKFEWFKVKRSTKKWSNLFFMFILNVASNHFRPILIW